MQQLKSLVIMCSIITLIAFITTGQIEDTYAKSAGGGQSTSFLKVKGSKKPHFTEYTDMPPNSQLILVKGKTAKHVDITGILHIEGEIKNTGSSTANGVSIIATFYDHANQTLGSETTSTNPDHLSPGQSAPFDINAIVKVSGLGSDLANSGLDLRKVASVKYHIDWGQ
jgi:hypothetical protein